jgi:hypothetical protein
LLGCEITRTETGFTIRLNQDLIDSVVTLMGVKNGKVVKIPGSHGGRPEKDHDHPLGPEDHSLYRTVVGKLLYIAHERPDMQYAVKEASRHLSSPTEEDMKELKKLARYLAGTMDVVLVLDVDMSDTMGSVTVKGCSDSDWAKNRDDRKSTTGGVIFVWGAPMLTFARTQPCVALASAEAELYGLSTVVMECKGLATFLEELGEYPIIEAHCDAAATISIASRLGFAKLKHIEIRHFWLQDEIREGRLVLHKIPSADNPADILTKILDVNDHARVAALVGIALVWPLLKVKGSSSSDHGFGRFLQFITLAASAYQGEASTGFPDVQHFVWDLVVYILCTSLPLLVALMFLQRCGAIQVGRALPSTVPPTLRITRDTRDSAAQITTYPTTRTALELHDVTVDGLRKIGSKVGITHSASRNLTKDQLMQVIRQNPAYDGVLL